MSFSRLQSNGPPKTVLIADDSSSSRDLLRYVLAYDGFQVIEAADGYQVLERAADISPDVFILDLNMPNCDGYSAAMQLRRLPQFINTPIVALSAVASEADGPRIEAAGFSLFLQKPFLPRKLRQCVRFLLEQTDVERK